MENKSLAEVFESVETTNKKGFWKKLFAFLGPAYLVSVGYMDPGNWATDIAGGSAYGYKLLWVLLMSNIIALLLQSHSARLGIVAKRDLAQASKESYPKIVNFFLYVFAEIAIAACDLAEVLGMAIGIQLLFGIPLFYGVVITVADTFLLLFLLNYGIRKMEAFIVSLIAIIGGCFLVELYFASPNPSEVASGLIPSLPDSNALYIAVGIIGATVMPHNLYLHSSLVQTRKFGNKPTEIKKVLKYNLFDSAIALNLAFFVNAAILILAGSTFHQSGMHDVSEIQEAHKLLEGFLGSNLAPVLFAVALIAAGQSSTITGTLAGQIIMEGYINLRIQPWLRRILTRLLAIIPALIVISVMGEQATGKLLVFSQVILSMQLGFAIIPLIHFVSDKVRMGEFAIGNFQKVVSWIFVIIIVSLNLNLVIDEIKSFSTSSSFLIISIQLFVLFSLFLLFFITFYPLVKKRRQSKQLITPHQIKDFKIAEGKTGNYKSIALAVDFSDADKKIIEYAISISNPNSEVILIHISETAGAYVYGSEITDHETEEDKNILDKYCKLIASKSIKCRSVIGFGNPKKSIPEIVNKIKPSLLIMGAHGHNSIKDIIFGTTVDKVRHRINIPVLIVKQNSRK